MTSFVGLLYSFSLPYFVLRLTSQSCCTFGARAYIAASDFPPRTSWSTFVVVPYCMETVKEHFFKRADRADHMQYACDCGKYGGCGGTLGRGRNEAGVKHVYMGVLLQTELSCVSHIQQPLLAPQNIWPAPCVIFVGDILLRSDFHCCSVNIYYCCTALLDRSSPRICRLRWMINAVHSRCLLRPTVANLPYSLSIEDIDHK